ncbi:hypothetical protein J2T38_001060 [Neisseria perflava]|uniref:hypothetical protein n=1 Tax=Neisseria perflava TaxID=33053 RepID=UPI0020A15434|nr:hypothetical protein [Neisseria perflava]MCP1772242.1 hypothetical protein [Neisseria perflava]
MRPTVILAVPYLYGLDRCIEKNLRFHGFDVINLCYDDRDTPYPNLRSRLKNLYHKHITRDGNYKKSLRFAPHLADISLKLAQLNGKKADYALCIRANIYPKEIIAAIRAHSKICVNYQWDGIDRFPDILEYLPYFDRFFVFDKQDIDQYPQYAFQTATNFYFDFPLPKPSSATKGGIYFLGGYDPTREADTRRFLDSARRLKLPLDFHIYSKDDRACQAFGSDGISYLDRSSVLTFDQNLQKIQTASAVVDFVSGDHQGLSFRIFDALRFGKKLITSNTAVQYYDFYRPENILVWNETASDKLADFLNTPCRALPENVHQKYSFGNWIRYVFDMPPYQAISLADISHN